MKTSYNRITDGARVLFAAVLLTVLAACQTTSTTPPTAEKEPSVPAAQEVPSATASTKHDLVAVAQKEPDWLEVLTAGQLTCEDAGGNSFYMEASADGTLKTKFSVHDWVTGSYSVLPDGSGWERTLPRWGTKQQKITRNGENTITIAGTRGNVNCSPSAA